jgi:hypothetical protein
MVKENEKGMYFCTDAKRYHIIKNFCAKYDINFRTLAVNAIDEFINNNKIINKKKI